jgi:predicted anti-sigma-YlaC factor YlaD
MSENNDMACREVVELLTEYLEEALGAADRARLEEHVSGCGGCTNALAQMRETIRLTGTLTEQDLPDPLRDSIRDAFLTWRETGSPSPGF